MSKVIGDYTAANSIDGSTNYLLIQPGNSSTAYKKINRNVFLGVTGQPADISSIQSLTNKTLDNTNTATLKDTLFTLQDDGDTTKQAKFQLSGLTTATTRTYTLPDASTTLVGTGTTQTLTAKTLTSPTINGGTIDNATITVDTVSGHTSANTGTIYGIAITSAKMSGTSITNSSITSSQMAAGSIWPQALVSGTGNTWAMQSWSTTWTNLTVGNGTVVTKFIQTGKIVFFRLSLTFGTTTSISGTVSFTVPVLPITSASCGTINFRFSDTGVANYYGSTVVGSGALGVPPIIYNTASTYATAANMTSTQPFTWGSTDVFEAFGWYEAA